MPTEKHNKKKYKKTARAKRANADCAQVVGTGTGNLFYSVIYNSVVPTLITGKVKNKYLLTNK